jgi:hypothetical protein
MKPSNFSAIGGWQSLLFCAGMYVVALFFSIFICSSIFYAVNSKSGISKSNSLVKSSNANTGKQVLAAVTP